MDNITLGQIKDILVWGSVVIGAMVTLYKFIMRGVSALFEPIKQELRNEKMQRLKSELTTFMFLADSNQISHEQRLLANEEYDDYIKMGGNSYIKNKYEKLVKEGKI